MSARFLHDSPGTETNLSSKELSAMSTRRTFLKSALLLPSILSARVFAQDNPAVPFADFEGGTWGDWTTEGDTFGSVPATSSLPRRDPRVQRKRFLTFP